MPKTKVVFRKFREGNKEVIAVFYEELERGYRFNSYMHVGQHGVCDGSITTFTARAFPHEYEDLKKELENLSPEPYDLDVRTKITYPKNWN